MVVKLFISSVIVFLFASCGTRGADPKVIDTNIGSVNAAIIYAIVDDSDATNKAVKKIFEFEFRQYMDYTMGSKVIIINNKSEIKDTNSLLYKIHINRTVDAMRDYLEISYSIFDNSTKKQIALYEDVRTRRMGWRNTARYISQYIAVETINLFGIRRYHHKVSTNLNEY